MTPERVGNQHAAVPPGEDAPIYLDHQATTPLDPRVAEAMAPWQGVPANPHARHHALGRAAARAVEEARGRIAAAIGGHAREIVLTSGATEADNLAIRGLVPGPDGRDTVVTVATEHAAVLAAARAVEAAGGRCVIVGVDGAGRVDLDALAAAVDRRTALVSVMMANNEIGTLQPLDAVARIARSAGARVHTDAAQALGRVALDVGRLDVDLVSLSAHKAYGPAGIGALWVRSRPPTGLRALMVGGGQQDGRRPGTVPTALAVGFGRAAEIAAAEREDEARRLAGLDARFLDALRSKVEDVHVIGPELERLPGCVNLAFPDVEAEDLLDAVPGLALSSGAACATGAPGPSPVLEAIGVPPMLARCSIRIGAGRGTTAEDMDAAAAALAAAVDTLRRGRAA
ncbi:MAG: aminotransferase class V-fold PLP-dependent enzyme [Azospirillaceae bacterium]